MEYRKTAESGNWTGETVHVDELKALLRSLEMATEYSIRVTAFTSVGDGNFTEGRERTDEGGKAY